MFAGQGFSVFISIASAEPITFHMSAKDTSNCRPYVPKSPRPERDNKNLVVFEHLSPDAAKCTAPDAQ